MKPLTQETICNVFNYDPATGEFWRILTGHNKSKTGTISVRRQIRAASRGYLQVGFSGKVYYVHRLVWVWMTGQIPTFIDHIDGNKKNNEWANLRQVLRDDNYLNLGVGTRNNSGVTGVYWHPAVNKYAVQITKNGKQKYLGCFDSIEEATAVRKEAESLLGFHPNHGERLSWRE
jgi:hypothetical protein